MEEGDKSQANEEQTETSTPEMGLSKKIEILKEENDRTERLLKEQKELIATNILGGHTPHTEEAQKPKEETPKEYRDRMMRGGV